MAYIKLNRNNFVNNLDTITTKVGDKNKIALVLKDNAYGHGIELIASLACDYGITKVVVRCNVEAQIVKEYFDEILILADNPTELNTFIYAINSLEQLRDMKHGTRVELKVDSGMHRNGIDYSELEEAYLLINEKGLALKGIFTHHCCADTLSSDFFTQEQIFKQIKQRTHMLNEKYNLVNIRYHSLNSAGLFRRSNFEEDDLVRVGIAAYGCLEMDKTLEQPNLKPVLSLYASKNSTRKLKSSLRLGYGGIFSSKENTVISNYDLGYADGLLRSASNNYTTPSGAKLLGRISMDNTTFESSKNELLIFNNASSYASSAGTIAYEVLTSLKHYIKRDFI
ncbi:MAG: alanine racemase [Helicobacteraceae bacterium]|nr:alanine racemase [Helicobacteraceae bacterium]